MARTAETSIVTFKSSVDRSLSTESPKHLYGKGCGFSSLKATPRQTRRAIAPGCMVRYMLIHGKTSAKYKGKLWIHLLRKFKNIFGS